MERQNGPAGLTQPTLDTFPPTPEKTRRESPRPAYCKIWAKGDLPVAIAAFSPYGCRKRLDAFARAKPFRSG
jgi:hypothetical protein